jgi:hypothetical protein
MRTQTNGTNGHIQKSLPELVSMFKKNKKPGRPSKEQMELKKQIEALQEGIEVVDPGLDTPHPNKKGRGGKPRATKAAPEEKQISIPTIEIGVITVTVIGTENLIMHAWDVKSKRQIAEKQQKKAGKPREARDPVAEYNAARYIDSKGRDCVPARSFKNAIVEAATFLPDVTKKLIKGAIYVKGDLLPIKHNAKKPPMREDMVRIGGMSKVADIRYRPEYVDWSVELTVEFDTSVFSAEQVVSLVNRAGFNVGVAEWRPTFGRFRVSRSNSSRS